jgi:serine protease Do
MSKSATSLILIFCVNFCFAGDPKPSTVSVATEIERKIISSSGAIETEKMIGAGSGTVIANNESESLILTNRHVVKDSTKMWVAYEDKIYKAEVVLVSDNGDDLALIKIKKKIKAVGISDKDADVNQEITHYGKMSGPYKGKSTGFALISDKNKPKENYVIMLFDMLCIPGDSGGGIFDKDGVLIGVNFGRMGDIDTGTGLSVPVSAVQDFLKKVNGWKFAKTTD